MGENKDTSIVKHEELGTLLVRRDGANNVVLVAKDVVLEDKLDYVAIGNKACPTVRCYDRMNQFAGCHVLTPPNLFADGKPVGNPYTERDATGAVTRCMARRMVVGRSPLGSPVVVDYTADFDITGYFRRDLLAKIRKERALGYLGERAEAPKPKEGSNEYWKFFDIDLGIGVWVNLACDTMLDLLETTAQRRQFALRIVQSIAKRNALAMHPAFGGGAEFLIPTEEKPRRDGKGTYKVAVAPPTHSVRVMYYKTDYSQAEVVALAEAVATTGVVPPSYQAQTVQGSGTVSDDAMPLIASEFDPHEAPLVQPTQQITLDGELEPADHGPAESDDMDPSTWTN